MDRKLFVWMLLPVWLPTVRGTAAPMRELVNVAGKLLFYQMEGNVTYVRETGELASDAPTETTFELFDPLKNYSSVKFFYTWDLGNGEVIKGTEPVVHYQYSATGNYTLRLRLAAEEPLPITGIYSANVKVLDAVKSIDLKEPLDYKVAEKTNFTFHIDGSPPMWACWRFLPNCLPDEVTGCTLTMLYYNILQLKHTFTSAGVHCLDISIRNHISTLQTSFSLNVKQNTENTHLLFILTSAGIIAAIFVFIMIIACRPRRRSQVAASSNAMFLKDRDTGAPDRVLHNGPPVESGEKEPLIQQQGTQYSS